jgi:hypothetical protein
VPAFEQKRLMANLVRDVLSVVLGYDSYRFELEASFLVFFFFFFFFCNRKKEQGVRSFEAVQVRNTLSSVLKGLGQLPATILYDYPNIASLAEWLLRIAGVRELNIHNVSKWVMYY